MTRVPAPALLALALALSACAIGGAPVASGPSSAPVAVSLAKGACAVEGFSVGADDQAAYNGPSGMAMRRVAHDTDAATGAVQPAGEVVCVPVQTLSSPLAVLSLSGQTRCVIESLRGALTADAPDNEAFVLRLFDAASGQPIKDAALVLEVRMPHHNRTNPRGHGPTNDMEAKGLPAQALGDGSYRVDPVDFSMAGPWLITARATVDGRQEKAHWALKVE